MIIDKDIALILGIDDLSSDNQKKIVSRLENIILTKLSNRIINKLPPKDKKKYIEILDSGKPEDIYELLSNRIPGLKDLIKKTSAEIIEEFKEKSFI